MQIGEVIAEEDASYFDSAEYSPAGDIADNPILSHGLKLANRLPPEL